MRSNSKYAVSNNEVFAEMLMRMERNPNPVTLSSLKNILKNRFKRDDIEALDYYAKYCHLKTTSSLSLSEIAEVLENIYSNYLTLDTKGRDLFDGFEKFETKYLY